MKTVEIIGYHRADLGKKTSRALRDESLVPCVMYGAGEQRHFAVPMALFRDLIYTPEVAMVDVNIEGSVHRCIVQEVQFHPVNEMILHADFFEVSEDKPVRMEIPVRLTGTAMGVEKGGKMSLRVPKLKVEALPGQMPDTIEVDVTDLDLGRSVKVGSIKAEGYKILNPKSLPVASVVIPRSLRGKQAAA